MQSTRFPRNLFSYIVNRVPQGTTIAWWKWSLLETIHVFVKRCRTIAAPLRRMPWRVDKWHVKLTTPWRWGPSLRSGIAGGIAQQMCGKCHVLSLMVWGVVANINQVIFHGWWRVAVVLDPDKIYVSAGWIWKSAKSATQERIQKRRFVWVEDHFENHL